MSLESVAAAASIDSAAAVTAEYEAADLGGHDPGGGADREGPAGAGVDDDLHGAFAEEPIEGVWSDAGPTGEGDTGFTVGLGCLGGVDHHGHDWADRPV